MNNKKSFINEGRNITDGKIIYGGFPRILKEEVDDVVASGDSGIPSTMPTQPSTPSAIPMPPGVPAYWYKLPSSPFGGDGENPGLPPGPGDPRWNKWWEEWQRRNPKPGPNATPQEREEYQRLLKQYQKWRDIYYRWWQQTYGRNTRPTG